jgi:hypothetical protein
MHCPEVAMGRGTVLPRIALGARHPLETAVADDNGTGAAEAAIAALSFGFLFVCMLGLLAIADAGDQATLATVAATNFTRIR